MTNKTIFSIILTLLLIASNSFAQFQNLSPEELKKLASQNGVSAEDYLKLQQTQTKSNLLPKTTDKQDTLFLSKPQVKPKSSLTVKAFSGRGGASGLKAFGYNVFNYKGGNYA